MEIARSFTMRTPREARRCSSTATMPHARALSVFHPRALRRDDDNTREICITISSWRVVQQKLVPLILECRDDAVLVKTLLKIYVMLTMPISKAAKEALLKPVNPKAEGDVRDQDRRRRENALAQQVCIFFKWATIVPSRYPSNQNGPNLEPNTTDHLLQFMFEGTKTNMVWTPIVDLKK